MRDENAAQQQLNSVWLSNSNEIRSRCEGEATAGGSDSYVDLLTCMQMADAPNRFLPRLNSEARAKTEIANEAHEMRQLKRSCACNGNIATPPR